LRALLKALTSRGQIETGGTGMTGLGVLTDADLARARQDPAFRHQLMADHLDLLLRELNKLRNSAPDATRARQIREGVDLAVRLANLLQKIAVESPGAQRVA